MNKFILTFMILSFSVFSEEKAEKKTYNEEEFKTALRVEMKKELENLDSKKLAKYFKVTIVDFQSFPVKRSRFSAGLMQQSDIIKIHFLVHRFAHVVDGEGR